MAKASNDNDSSTAAAAATPSNRISMKQSNTFPFRLHEMLDTVAQEGSESIVSWCAGNHTAFKVHKPQDFVKTIMPRFFQQTKYKSFQRQCNLWGFERLLHGPEKGGYEHPDGFFVRGNPSLVNKMVRRKIKRRSSLETEGSQGNVVTTTTGPVPVVMANTVPPDMITSTSQRRPSIVSCSSNQSGGSSDALLMTGQASFAPVQGYYITEPGATATSVPPQTPMVSNYYGSSVENSPGDAPEGLYLPPPSTPQQQQDAVAAVETEASANGDSLFLEGLSAFFDDEEIASIVSDPPVRAGSEQHQVTAPPQVQPHASLPAAYQRLQPKRRLSMELFVASRQQNSNEIILDLLSDTDTLQKSLEMELMCAVPSLV